MKNHKVLIVDDEIEFAETLAERLEMRKFEVKFAESIESAISLIEGGWKPEVILLDLKMPKVSGLEGAEIFKKLLPSVHIIMLTGHGSITSGIESMKRGICDYFVKPVDLEELINRIYECLKEGK